MRVCANEASSIITAKLIDTFGWPNDERIEWLSPVVTDDFAEYYDQEFLTRLGIGKLSVALSDFWPKSGSRWDGLARTELGKLILVEAKAYIEEGVDFKSKAGPKSMTKIRAAVAEAKETFGTSDDALWE